jgi:hypothetical protein
MVICCLLTDIEAIPDVYYMDRYLALLLGRPSSIQDDDCDALPPTDTAESSSVSYGFAETREELDSVFAFVRFRSTLATIMGLIVKNAFRLAPSGYDETLQLDQALDQWRRKLPSSFQVITRADSNLSFLGASKTHITRRFILSTDYNFARIALHRPHLVTRARSTWPTDQCQPSLEACYKSAIDDLWARAVNTELGIKDVRMGTYRITTCAVILG